MTCHKVIDLLITPSIQYLLETRIPVFFSPSLVFEGYDDVSKEDTVEGVLMEKVGWFPGTCPHTSLSEKQIMNKDLFQTKILNKNTHISVSRWGKKIHDTLFSASTSVKDLKKHLLTTNARLG